MRPGYDRQISDQAQGHLLRYLHVYTVVDLGLPIGMQVSDSKSYKDCLVAVRLVPDSRLPRGSRCKTGSDWMLLGCYAAVPERLIDLFIDQCLTTVPKFQSNTQQVTR